MTPSIRAAHRRLDVAIALGALVLSVTTLVIVADPDLQLAIVAPGLDLVINTVTTLVAAAVSALAFARFREQGPSGSAFQAAAFAVLAAAGALFCRHNALFGPGRGSIFNLSTKAGLLPLGGRARFAQGPGSSVSSRTGWAATP